VQRRLGAEGRGPAVTAAARSAANRLRSNRRWCRAATITSTARRVGARAISPRRPTSQARTRTALTLGRESIVSADSSRPHRVSVTLDNWRDLLADAECPTCQSKPDQWEVELNLNNNGYFLVCSRCRLKHPASSRVTFLSQGNKPKRDTPAESTSETWERCGGYCYGCGVDGQVLALLGMGKQQHHTRPYVDHGNNGPLIPMCTWCHGLISAHQAALRRFITHKGTLRGAK